MQLPFLSAAAVGMALMAVSPITDSRPGGEGAVSLVGAHLYASESHIDRWGDPVSADALALEDLGTVADVVTDGGAGHLVVEVGGVWGWGGQAVTVGLDRVHLLATDAGERRLVVDLSARGAEPETL